VKHRKKPGPKPRADAKREYLHAKVSAEDLKRYQAAARVAGQPLSAWVRAMLDKHS
jgi:hypothetical protein